jgi:hypothetical protein
MRIDHLFQFIVPLTFLAIWALTSLFNREAQPLPPRTGRAPNPAGPRPGGGLPIPPRPPERRPESLNRDPNQRWANPPPPRRPSGRPDDDILIIESEPRRTSPTSATPPRSGTAAPKRPARSRPAPPAAKRPEPAPPRTLSSSMGGLTHPLARLQEVDLHKDSQAPLPPPEEHDLTKLPANDPPRTMFRPGAISFDARGALVTPSTLREALILNEILRPPLAIRRSRERA